MKSNEMTYKADIVATRVGGLGSSDASMVLRIGDTGEVNYSAKERLAQMVGLIERRQFSTPAIRLGDKMENTIFSILKEKVSGSAVSNPLYIHKALSEKYGFNIQDHIDFEIEDEDSVTWFECKASIKDTTTVMKDYEAQLAWHKINLMERSEGKRPRLFLVHYNTEGVTENDTFDAERLSMKEFDTIGKDHIIKRLIKGLDIIKEALSNNFEFIPMEELDARNLPAPLQKDMDRVCAAIRQALQIDDMVDEFKKRMLELMQQGSVKKITNDYFTISLVNESVSVGFDKSKFQKENPDLYDKYNTKKSNRKAYVTIRPKEEKQNLIQ